MDNKKYAVVYQSLDLETREPIVIRLADIVIGNKFEALGKAYTFFIERICQLKRYKEKYEVVREYEYLVEEFGYIWEIKEQDFIETWMLLEKEEDN